jgi:hypothetical protein
MVTSLDCKIMELDKNPKSLSNKELLYELFKIRKLYGGIVYRCSSVSEDSIDKSIYSTMITPLNQYLSLICETVGERLGVESNLILDISDKVYDEVMF